MSPQMSRRRVRLTGAPQASSWSPASGTACIIQNCSQFDAQVRMPADEPRSHNLVRERNSLALRLESRAALCRSKATCLAYQSPSIADFCNNRNTCLAGRMRWEQDENRGAMPRVKYLVLRHRLAFVPGCRPVAGLQYKNAARGSLQEPELV